MNLEQKLRLGHMEKISLSLANGHSATLEYEYHEPFFHVLATIENQNHETLQQYHHFDFDLQTITEQAESLLPQYEG